MFKSKLILLLKIFLFFLITILILVLDLYSKQFIINNYWIIEKKYIFIFINFLYIYNPGVAFSLCYKKSNCNSIKIILISIISIVAVLVLMYLIKKYLDIYNLIFFSFIIGGALGNLYNRIIYGVVIDFIDIYISKWHLPTFNIADYAICIGTIKILLYILFL